jgi:hypothetical protein
LVGLSWPVYRLFRRKADGAFPRDTELSREGHGVLTTDLMPGLAVALDDLLGPS